MSFPFGINKTMDDHAISKGLSHWSCTSPTCNDNWQRIDGKKCSTPPDKPGGYVQILKQFDIKEPLCL